MRVLYFIIILLIEQFLIACNHEKEMKDKDQYKVEHVVFTSEEDDPGPPPHGFTSHYKNLKDWLISICENEKPQKRITTYHISLFEGQDDYTLCFTGINTYEVSQYHTTTRIEFAPKDMYFTLPASEYSGLKREQVLKSLTSHLKEFITSDKFRRSFLKDAKSITTDWNGEIWTK